MVMIQRTSRQEMMTVKEFAQTQKKAIKAGEKSLQYQWDVKPPTDEAENHVLSDMEKKNPGLQVWTPRLMYYQSIHAIRCGGCSGAEQSLSYWLMIQH